MLIASFRLVIMAVIRRMSILPRMKVARLDSGSGPGSSIRALLVCLWGFWKPSSRSSWPPGWPAGLELGVGRGPCVLSFLPRSAPHRRLVYSGWVWLALELALNLEPGCGAGGGAWTVVAPFFSWDPVCWWPVLEGWRGLEGGCDVWGFMLVWFTGWSPSCRVPLVHSFISFVLFIR